MHTIGKSIAIFVTATLVLNAMAPMLAHAAKHLQGEQVNANALVRDAYIAVTYRDGNGRERTARGWIDAIGETSFTIRSGGLKSKTTIAYAKVLSVIMSEASSVPAKQMNEVNRFIRNMKAREREQAKEEASEARAPALAQTENNAPEEVIAGVERFIGERARQVVVAKGRYVGVTYRKDNGKIETVEGFVQARDETELTIRRGIWQKKIPLNGIDVLIVCEHPSQLQHAKRIALRNKKRDEDRPPVRIAKKLLLGPLVGGSFFWLGGAVGGGLQNNIGSKCSDKYLGCIEGVVVGAGIAYTVGMALGVSIVDPYDQSVKSMLGSLMGLGIGILSVRLKDQTWPALFVGPLVGSVIMSERSRKLPKDSRFSIGLAPDRNGNVSAIATLRF